MKHAAHRVIVAILGTLFLAPALLPASAAVDMFLKIEGIEGESTDRSHRGEIDVLSYSWEIGRAADSASPRGAGRSDVQDISLTKYVDKSSPILMQACAEGKHLPEARLIARRAGGDAVDYLVIDMKKVLVTSVSTGGSGGEDRLTENVTFNFGEVKVTYTPQAPDGSAGAPTEFHWNAGSGDGAGRSKMLRRVPSR